MKQNKIYVMIHCFNKNCLDLEKDITICINTGVDEIIIQDIDYLKYFNNENEINKFLSFLKKKIKIGVMVNTLDDILFRFIEQNKIHLNSVFILDTDFESVKKLNCNHYYRYYDGLKSKKNYILHSTGPGKNSFDFVKNLDDKIFNSKLILLSNQQYCLPTGGFEKEIVNFNFYIDQTENFVDGFIINFTSDFNEENVKRFSEKIHNYKENV